MSRRTVQEALEGTGAIGIPLGLPCPCCLTVQDVGAIVEALPGDQVTHDWICATCVLDAARAVIIAQEVASLAVKQTWDSSRGADVRAMRYARLRATDYLVNPDYPLSDLQLTVVSAYRQALRDITETFASPDDVIWPAEPGGPVAGA